MRDFSEGFKKVSKKARRGRKGNPAPHKRRNTKGTVRDPVSKGLKKEKKRRELEIQDSLSRQEMREWT